MPGGDAQPVLHVGGCLLLIERIETRAHGDSLSQLPQPGSGEVAIQLGLARQDDLEELAVADLEVREETDLLEDLVSQVLGLIDDEERRGMTGMELDEQELVERMHHLRAREPGVGDRQLLKDHPMKVVAADGGVGDEERAHRHVQVLEQRPEECRLARPDLAHQADEAPALLHPVDECRQGFPVGAPREEERRVGRDRERLGSQAEVVLVHRLNSLFRGSRVRGWPRGEESPGAPRGRGLS